MYNRRKVEWRTSSTHYILLPPSHPNHRTLMLQSQSSSMTRCYGSMVERVRLIERLCFAGTLQSNISKLRPRRFRLPPFALWKRLDMSGGSSRGGTNQVKYQSHAHPRMRGRRGTLGEAKRSKLKGMARSQVNRRAERVSDPGYSRTSQQRGASNVSIHEQGRPSRSTYTSDGQMRQIQCWT